MNSQEESHWKVVMSQGLNSRRLRALNSGARTPLYLGPEPPASLFVPDLRKQRGTLAAQRPGLGSCPEETFTSETSWPESSGLRNRPPFSGGRSRAYPLGWGFKGHSNWP